MAVDSQITWTTLRVADALKSSVLRLKSTAPGSKSAVWKNFSLVEDEHGKDLPFAACKHCHVAFSFTGRQSGTSTLRRHKCSKLRDASQPPITLMAPCKKTITQADKDIARNASVDFVCRDLRPFVTVQGEGFIDMIQRLFELQHKSTSLLDARLLLPHPTTVSRCVGDKAAKVRSNLAEDLQEVYRSSRVSYTTDMWTESHNQRSFIALTAHWIDDDWQLHSRVMTTEEFSSSEKKTGANIKTALNAIFEK